MPVIKRLIEPIHCSRAPIPKGVKHDLEAVCVNTLSAVILQLSSVAKHAEGIFAEIFTEANLIHKRTCSVHQRLDQLSVKVTKLDSAGEEISLQEINLKKPFKMTINSDQQVLSRQTLPEAMMESYDRCHPVPNLSLLTKYRHDGKDALKFYTDPSYFFELWKQKMNVEYEKRRRKKRREQRDKKRDTEKKVVKGVKKKELTKNIPDWEIQERKEKTAGNNQQVEQEPIHVDEVVSPAHSTSSGNALSPRTTSTMKRGSNASVIGRPVTAPPPPPTASPAKLPPPAPLYEDQPPIKSSTIPPPPPPPPPAIGQTVPDTVPKSTSQHEAKVPMPIGGPPPPPPPPPPMGVPPSMPSAPAPPVAPPPPSQMSNADLTASIQSVVLSAPKPQQLQPASDPRNDLLTAIREGMNLRKAVQITKEERKEVGMGNDVASILSRRIALELTDSEGDSEFSDEGEWSDD